MYICTLTRFTTHHFTQAGKRHLWVNHVTLKDIYARYSNLLGICFNKYRWYAMEKYSFVCMFLSAASGAEAMCQMQCALYRQNLCKSRLQQEHMFLFFVTKYQFNEMSCWHKMLQFITCFMLSDAVNRYLAKLWCAVIIPCKSDTLGKNTENILYRIRFPATCRPGKARSGNTVSGVWSNKAFKL